MDDKSSLFDIKTPCSHDLAREFAKIMALFSVKFFKSNDCAVTKNQVKIMDVKIIMEEIITMNLTLNPKYIFFLIISNRQV